MKEYKNIRIAVISSKMAKQIVLYKEKEIKEKTMESLDKDKTLFNFSNIVEFCILYTKDYSEDQLYKNYYKLEEIKYLKSLGKKDGSFTPKLLMDTAVWDNIEDVKSKINIKHNGKYLSNSKIIELLIFSTYNDLKEQYL